MGLNVTGAKYQQQLEFNSSVVTVFFNFDNPVNSNVFHLTFQAIRSLDEDLLVKSNSSLETSLLNVIKDDYVPGFLDYTRENNDISELLDYMKNNDYLAEMLEFMEDSDYFAELLNEVKEATPNCPPNICPNIAVNTRPTWSSGLQTEENKTTFDIKDEFLLFTADYYKYYNSSNVDDYSDFYKFYQPVVSNRYLTSLNGNISDFIIQCSFDGENCGQNVFSNSEDFMLGSCFTFHPNRLAEKLIFYC